MGSYQTYLRVAFAFLVVVPTGGVFLTHTGSVLAAVDGDESAVENPV